MPAARDTTASGVAGPQDLAVYGTFDDVASAVEHADADTVVVLSCPELDGDAPCAGWPGGWNATRSTWSWRARWSMWPGRARRSGRSTGCRCCTSSIRGCTAGRGWSRRSVRPGRGVRLLAGATFGPLLLDVSHCGCGALPAGRYSFVRCGSDVTGALFRIFKFRSMYVDAEARLAELRHLNEHDGVLFKIRDDPRVTRVGRWLRRFSLDELPQLLNVLLGTDVAGRPAAAVARGGGCLRRRRAAPARRQAGHDRACGRFPDVPT